MMNKNTNKSIKIAVDICMSLILLFVMAYQVTGDKYHEVLGAGMLVLFIVHNVLNYKWYSHLFKGKYPAVRIVRVIINFATFAAIVITGYSGIVMSEHVFAFLHIKSGLMTARMLHLSFSYWTFVFMGIHLGLHWNMITGRIKTEYKALIWLLRIAAIVAALYGAYLFGSSDIYTYMFMKTHFAMLDYSKPAIIILFDNLMMMAAFVYIGYYINKAFIKKVNIPYILPAIVIIAVSIISSVAGSRTSGGGWGDTAVSSFDSSWTMDNSGMQGGAYTMQQITGDKINDNMPADIDDGFVYINGGTYMMGSPETENWRGADEANYYGHYPYDIEENYFSQQNLSTKPGVYRETTVAVDSFRPNNWGLYNMHGNVSEWVWDYYGEYDTFIVHNPYGAETGSLRIYRGGGWNDFAKKTIIPFCSHGGGRFGQSLTAIAKLATASKMGTPLSIHYGGGSSMPSDVSEWLKTNGVN